MSTNENQISLQSSLKQFQQEIFAIANQSKTDLWEVLIILRSLEEIHREIREELFEPSLPDNRQKLYQLLKEVDELGGWPYIPRMRLKEFFVNYEKAEAESID
jgi:hypothetical protein